MLGVYEIIAAGTSQCIPRWTWSSLLQVLISEANPSMLVKLRDAINVCMSRITRKPLQQLCQNIPSVVSTFPACPSY